MSILTQMIHRPLEPLNESNLNMVNSMNSSSSSQSPSMVLNDSLKRVNGVHHQSDSSESSHTTKRKSDEMENANNTQNGQGEAKKQKKRVPLINENDGKKDENTSPSSKKDEKRKEKEAREEEKRKEKETKEEEKRKEKEAKEEERRKEKEEKEEEKRKEKEAKEEEKRKEKEAREAKEEERRKEREAKEEIKNAKRKEKEAKEAEKAEKEAEKEARRAKELLLQKRSANLMSAFVVQRPSNSTSSPAKKEEKAEEHISDFNKTFLPCPIKNLAPINRFHRKVSDTFDMDLAKTDQDLLGDFLQHSRKSDKSQKRRSRKGIKAPISVRESMRLITEAGVLGDDRLLEENGKKGLACLTDRKRLPIKLLHFASDRRPAWYGTWTRSSNFVSARKPLAQDPVALDYSYDSDAEWEDFDPMEGDDLNDNDDKEEEDHCSRSDSDSEMDDWLVDDLEVEEEDEEMEELNNEKRSISRISESPLKAAVTKLEVRKKPKKFKTIGRRFETKLVKFETGPHWEEVLGVPSFDGFKAYQMEMLNDCCPGINPFTFTSSNFNDVEASSTTVPSVKPEQTQSNINSPATTRITAPSTSSPSLNGNKSNSTTSNGVSEAIMTKAKMFPEENLSELLRSIDGNSSIRPILIEELRVKFASLGKTGVPKTTLEACLTMYAEKQTKKAGGKWVIKSDFRSMAGL